MHDRGLTHIALPVTDLDRSLVFYATYARMEVIHRREESGPGESKSIVLNAQPVGGGQYQGTDGRSQPLPVFG